MLPHHCGGCHHVNQNLSGVFSNRPILLFSCGFQFSNKGFGKPKHHAMASCGFSHAAHYVAAHSIQAMYHPGRPEFSASNPHGAWIFSKGRPKFAGPAPLTLAIGLACPSPIRAYDRPAKVGSVLQALSAPVPSGSGLFLRPCAIVSRARLIQRSAWPSTDNPHTGDGHNHDDHHHYRYGHDLPVPIVEHADQDSRARPKIFGE